MNDNSELFDKAIDNAAKELAADAPEALLKGVMYRIEMDEKPKRFAFGRFTAIAAAAAAVIITVSLGSKYLGGSTSSDSTLNLMTSNQAPVMQYSMDAKDTSAYGADTSAADTGESGAESFESNAFIESRGIIPPNEQALYDYLGELEIISVVWETGLIAAVELINADGETETQKITFEIIDGKYTVDTVEKNGDILVICE